jgi:hypothetical protein
MKPYRESWKHLSAKELVQKVKTRTLNDRMRTLPPRTQDMVICVGSLQDAEATLMQAVYRAAQTFIAFTEDNDPHGEHDCATFEFMGERFLFKIDYYDTDLRYGSEEPWNQDKTRRVMTLMYARDY